MNKQLTIAAIAGALILPLSFVAKADGISGGTEFTVYGRVVAGVYRDDSDKQGESATWEIGGTGIDGGRLSGSRLGFSADRDLGNGMNAGFELEQEFDGGGGPNIQRHRYVYLNGGYGNFSVGNNVGPMGATSYDGSYFLGGNFRKGTDRRDGLHYSNSVGGFNFGITLTGNEGDASKVATAPLSRNMGENDADYIARLTREAESDAEFALRASGEADAAAAAALTRYTATPGSSGVARIADTRTDTTQGAVTPETDAAYIARLEALNRAAAENTDDSKAARIADEDIDRTIVGIGYDFGAFAVNVGHDADNTDTDRDITALLVSGDVGPLHYKVGYEQQDDATPDGENDLSAVGLFLSYAASENDKVYLEYESADDDHTPTVAGTDTDEGGTATVLGYERKFGGGAVFVAEYRSVSNDASNGAPADADNSPSRLTLAMIVNF